MIDIAKAREALGVLAQCAPWCEKGETPQETVLADFINEVEAAMKAEPVCVVMVDNPLHTYSLKQYEAFGMLPDGETELYATPLALLEMRMLSGEIPTIDEVREAIDDCAASTAAMKEQK